MMAKTGRFYFTVSDLARLLGKAAVTVRAWERQGLVSLPRNSKGDRRLSSSDIIQTAEIAWGAARITEQRLHLIQAAMLLLEIIEEENL